MLRGASLNPQKHKKKENRNKSHHATNGLTKNNSKMMEEDRRRIRKSRIVYFLFQTFAVFCMLYVFFWVIPRLLNLV